MEYLLINHPLDCPICDQGGECDLQDQTIVFGNDFGRFYELKKRSVLNKNFGILVKTSLNRCIQCSRCTRFLDEVCSITNIQLLGRGLNTEISSFTLYGGFIKSEIIGNIIDICPVGALISKVNSFKGRF
jgi:NADH dehydrogenase (ubiquinone) Fe-S protein 1